MVKLNFKIYLKINTYLRRRRYSGSLRFSSCRLLGWLFRHIPIIPITVTNITVSGLTDILLCTTVIHLRSSLFVTLLRLWSSIPRHSGGSIRLRCTASILRFHVFASLLRQLVEILSLGCIQSSHDGHSSLRRQLRLRWQLVAQFQGLRQLLWSAQARRIHHGTRRCNTGISGHIERQWIRLDAGREDFSVGQAALVFFSGPFVCTRKIIPVFFWNITETNAKIMGKWDRRNALMQFCLIFWGSYTARTC